MGKDGVRGGREERGAQGGKRVSHLHILLSVLLTMIIAGARD